MRRTAFIHFFICLSSFVSPSRSASFLLKFVYTYFFARTLTDAGTGLLQHLHACCFLIVIQLRWFYSLRAVDLTIGSWVIVRSNVTQSCTIFMTHIHGVCIKKLGQNYAWILKETNIRMKFVFISFLPPFWMQPIVTNIHKNQQQFSYAINVFATM